MEATNWLARFALACAIAGLIGCNETHGGTPQSPADGGTDASTDSAVGEHEDADTHEDAGTQHDGGAHEDAGPRDDGGLNGLDAAADGSTDTELMDAGSDASTATDAGSDASELDASDDGDSSITDPEPPPPFEGVRGALTDWHTYQGDRSHSGAVAVELDEADFSLRWSYQAQSTPVGPVTVSGSRAVFASNRRLICVNAFSGEQLWLQDFSTRDSLSPPAITADRVYVQTGGHENSFLWGLDAATGQVQFQSAYGNQWSTYFAPTVDDGGVYVAGGYYGGMYAFDAETGAQRWFVGLNQYDQFTPTVTDDRVIAYTGDYGPSLTVVDKASGALEAEITDPNFSWNGWSMNTVAVVGGDDDSIAIHGGRLIRFDHDTESIGWELAETFIGQPAVVAGLIYAVNGNALDVRLESTGERVWSWHPGTEGTLRGNLIVTPTHVFLSTANQTVAVSMESHLRVWSYPAGGVLSLAQGALFIATGTSLVVIDLIGDTDDDGLPDAWELAHGGDFDPAIDQDDDGLLNEEEYEHHTDPLEPDTDDDGLRDGRELELGTLPLVADSDLDLLTDGDEVLEHETDPLSDDSDGDEIDDSAEVEAGLDPNDPSDASLDTDRDGYTDRHEVYAGTDRQDALSRPRVTDWGMIQGNARHDGYQPALLTVNRFSTRWSKTFEYTVKGTAVGGGRVYLTGGSATLALDAGDGNVAWLHAFASEAYPGGPSSTSAPSYANSLVYVHTGGHEDTALWALTPATGATVFRGTHGAQWPSYGQPTISGGRAYMNGGYYGGMVAMDALTTGALLWSASAPWVDYWEPAVAGERVYIPLGGGLGVLSSAGANLGSITDSLPVTTPVLGRRGNVLFAGPSLVSLDVARGQRAWSSQHAGLGSFGLPAVGNGRVFAVRGGVLEVFNEVSGRRLWTWSPSGGGLSSNVVLTASHVFVASAAATYAIDLQTRQAVYTHGFGGALAMGNEGALFVVNGMRVDAIELEGDSDGDGLPEWWERKHGGDLQPNADLDGDGLTALEEHDTGTDPRDADSDDDALPDGEEVELGTDPLRADSDFDGLSDANEVSEGSDPLAEDTDGDGLNDGAEVRAGLDPLAFADAAQDRDSDGFSNALEIFAGSNPSVRASVPVPRDWGMVQGNASHNGYQPIALDEADFTLGWTATLSAAASAPAVSDRFAYVTSGTQLVALALSDGAVDWSYAFTSERFGSVSAISGPSYGNELVYVHTGGHEDTALWAFEPDDGNYEFRGVHGAQWPRYSAPTIYEDRAFMNGGYTGGMVALDALYGTSLWTGTAPWEDYWEPAVDARGVFIVEAGDLKALDHDDGALLFRVESSLPVQTPVIGQQGMVVIAGPNLVAIDIAGRREGWRTRFAGQGNYGLPAIGNGRVFALRAGTLEVFSEASGERLWTFRPPSDALSSNLVLTASHVFAASATRTYAIDLATRSSVWSRARGGNLALGPEGNLIIASGTTIEMIETLP